MKLIITLFLISTTCVAQTIKVLSAKDKSPLPFAFITIKNDVVFLQQITDVNGVATIGKEFKTNELYTITIKSVGYKTNVQQLTGGNLNQLTEACLLPSNVQLQELVITAQYTPTITEQAIQKIKIIDKQKIAQMGAVNLRDVLTNQLNVRLQQDNILGAGISCQGVSGENVKILCDGIPMIGRLNGNIDLSQINVNNVERIEIVEGPLSVQYGTNALAGTINIITKKNNVQKYQLGASAYYESIGTYNLNANLSYSKNKYLLQINGGRNYFDGWNSNDNLFVLPHSKIADSSRYKQWKPRLQYFADVGYNYQLKKINVGVKSAFFTEKIINRGYPNAPYLENAFDDYYYTQRFDNSVTLNGKMNKYWSIQSVNAYNYYGREKQTLYKNLTTLNETATNVSNGQDTTSFSLLMLRASLVHANDSAKINYEFGYDINHESALGKRLQNNLQAMGDYALYSTAEYKLINKLIIKPGLRYGYNTIYNAPVVPSLNIRWQLAHKHSLRGSYAKGYRAPSIKELYFYFVDINHNIIGNKNLKAETSNNYMLSYNYTTPIQNANYKLDVSSFYNQINNLITLAQISPTLYSYINVGHYKTLGVQLSNTLHYQQLNVQLAASYIGRDNQLPPTLGVSNYSYSPELQANASYLFTKLKTTVSAFYKYNGRLPNLVLINNELQQNYISSYSIFDVTLNQQLINNTLNVTIGCKNILNVTNINANTTTGAHSQASSTLAMATGRNYFVKLTLNLSQLKNDINN